MGRPKSEKPAEEMFRASILLPKKAWIKAQYLHSLTDSKKGLLEAAFEAYISTLPELGLEK